MFNGINDPYLLHDLYKAYYTTLLLPQLMDTHTDNTYISNLVYIDQRWGNRSMYHIDYLYIINHYKRFRGIKDFRTPNFIYELTRTINCFRYKRTLNRFKKKYC